MTGTTRPGLAARMLVAMVRLYQSTVAFRTPRCRFSPTCSQYAVEALTVHGAGAGTWLATRRILRCHPFHPGGVDEVPPGRSPATPTSAAASRDVSADTPAA